MAAVTEEGVEKRDPRLEFIQETVLRSLRVKPEKWARLLISDEQRSFINKFIENYQPQVYPLTLILTLTACMRTWYRHTSLQFIVCT